ncbi:MAG TPA: LytTR family DNA-binding domain-containing protein [Bacteroidia bacterium]|jgi:two-component system LytT family response regulator|nr:LytTR family DNA-binding domain-containing protein [Bacteroidia bacterium]
MGETTSATLNPSFIDQLSLKEKGKTIVVNTADIIWFEADTNYVKIHTDKSVHIKKTSLKELELMLNPNVFVRIHRSSIVCLENIKSLFPYFDDEYIVVLDTGKALRLSRAYLNKLEQIQKGMK